VLDDLGVISTHPGASLEVMETRISTM